MDPYVVAILRGDGLIARFGDAVMYIADETSSARPVLVALEEAAETKQSGALFAERLAALAFGTGAVTLAPFGLIAPVAEGLVLLLRGTVAAEIETGDGVKRLSGARALTWVDEVLTDPISRITVSAGDGSGLSGAAETDLRAGVVPGGGFVWTPSAVTEARGCKSESVVPETMQRVKAATAPAPAAAPAAAAPAAPAAATHIRLPATGSAPAHTSAHSAPAHTSALPGVLASQDGAVYPLDRRYVIGRDPLRDESVRNATAVPITVQDPHVSRVHAYVWTDNGAVFVRDASTPGGTFIVTSPNADWTQIGTTPTKLEPGGILRVGEQVLIYQPNP